MTTFYGNDSLWTDSLVSDIIQTKEIVMTNLVTLFRAASNETISLIRYRLPLLKGFLRFHDWTLHNVSQAIAQGNFYAAAVHAQACLLAISEGPLRWILWAVLGVRKTPALDQMLSKKSALSELPKKLKNALYGTGVRDRLSSQLEAIRRQRWRTDRRTTSESRSNKGSN